MSNRYHDGQILTDWGLLAQGKTLGKKVVIPFTPAFFGGPAIQKSQVNILECAGQDHNALQLSLTLSPTFVVNVATAGILDVQRVTGEQDNEGLITSGFAGFANPVAVVEWGIGGISNKVEADFLNGLVLNLSASWLRLSAYIDAKIESTTANLFYTLSAFIGPGHAKTNNAQKTVVTFAPVVGNVFATPRYAKQVTIAGLGAGVFPAPWTITFFRDPLAALPIAAYVFTDGSAAAGMTQAIDIPNGAFYFSVESPGPIPAIVNAIFDLAI